MDIATITPFLEKIKGTTFAQIKARTKVTTLKKGHPFGNLIKVAWLNVTVNPNYEKSVNRALAKSGGGSEDFKASSMPWGKFVEKRVLIENKGKFYLRVQLNDTTGAVYHDTTDGAIYKESEIKEWLRERNKPVVQVRSFNIANILEIKAFKATTK